jgi:1-acyl-sn-glycerol-3-phosphate acyltransferase
MAEATELDRAVRDALTRKPRRREAAGVPFGVVGYERSTPMYNFCRACARVIGTMCQDLVVYDAKNVPLTGGVVLVSNHQSFVDPAYIAAKLPRALSFLAKSELFKPPVFGWGIRQCNAFPVKQGAGDVGAMKASIALLQAGKALLVFPEGTRTPDGELQPIAGGAALVIKRAKVPVVPVGIQGGFETWPAHKLLPRTGKVRIKFGEPVILHDLDGRKIVGRIEEELKRLIGDLREIRAGELASMRLPRKRLETSDF